MMIAASALMIGCSNAKQETPRDETVTEHISALEESQDHPTVEVLTKAFVGSLQLDTSALSTEELDALVITELAVAEIWDPLPHAMQMHAAVPQENLIGRGYCGARDSASAQALRRPRFPSRFLKTRDHPVISIPMAFHIITDRRTRGSISSSVIDRQVALLNAVFGPNISFHIHKMETVVNDQWFRSGAFNISPSSANEMTRALALRPDSVLNVYTNACGEMDLLGEASFPWFDTKGHYQDGVVVHFETLPGMGMRGFDEGKTLAHEVGHYLGLYHTFHDGTCETCACDSPEHNGCATGDEVDDTPPQKYCHQQGCGRCQNGLACEDCPDPCDTCPDPDVDQVANFMGYNPDPCMTLFTPGQFDRMFRSVQRFRREFIVP
jgi:hypothetical protein